MRKKQRKSRGPNRFKKTEVTRLTKAVVDAGLTVEKVSIGVDGTISLIPANRGRPVRGSAELDSELEEFQASHP
jgi:hypothetical protein